MAASTDTDLTPDLIDRVRKLSPEAKDRLFDVLLHEFQDPPEPSGAAGRPLQDVLTERWERYKRGEEPTYTLEETMAFLRSRVGRTP